MVGSSRCSARIDSSAPRRARLCGHSSGVIISSTASPTSATRSCSEPPCCRRSSSRGSSPPRPLVDAASPRSTRRPTDCLAPPTCPRWRLRWKRFVPASPATSYLESHRAKLSARKYLREARRNWFEIWVPQRPSEWPKRKIVFPDIAESPRFLLDTSKAIVNGDCYWMALGDDVADDLAYLLLAVGNATFAMRYYDAVCGNRLYAGRRRFITQYVKTFPLPERRHPAVARIVGLARELVHCQAAHGSIEDELNDLVWASFGLEEHDPIRGARPGR